MKIKNTKVEIMLNACLWLVQSLRRVVHLTTTSRTHARTSRVTHLTRRLKNDWLVLLDVFLKLCTSFSLNIISHLTLLQGKDLSQNPRTVFVWLRRPLYCQQEQSTFVAQRIFAISGLSLWYFGHPCVISSTHDRTYIPSLNLLE